MDQLKVVWAVMVKYHFWILMSLVLLTSVGSFYSSRQAIDQEVTTRIGAVTSTYRNVSNLASSAGTHPNELSNEEMKKSVSLLTNDVKLAWESQYNRQRGILVWPEDVGKSETLKKLNSYRPIEFFLEYSVPPKPDPLSLTEREVYRDYVKDVFPKLAKIVGANWTATMRAASGGVGPGAYDPSSSNSSSSAGPITNEPTPLVIWETGSQSKLQSEIVPWFDPSTPPSTLEICYTQEDLWVLDGILRVIKRTNGNARENFQAPIKKIEWIRLGKAARADAGSVMVVGIPTGSGGPSQGPGGYPSGPQAGGPGGTSDYSATPSPGGPGGSGVRSLARPDPADGRYVDSDYKPVPSSRLRSAMQSSAPSDALFAVAKRIPVQFRLDMDPTRIATLISECGNNSLLIEVKQVRVNGQESVGGGSFGGGGGGGGSQAYAGASSGDSSSGSGPSGVGGAYESAAETAGKSGDVPVEIYAIVYLFNPVDIQKLGLDKVTAETALETTVEGVAKPNPAANNPTPENGGGNAPIPALPETPQAANEQNEVPPNGVQPPAPGNPPVEAPQPPDSALD